MLIFASFDDLVEALETRAQESRNNIGKQRTKVEDNEMKGQVMAFNEAIYMVKALKKGLETGYKGPNNHEATDKVESVA